MRQKLALAASGQSQTGDKEEHQDDVDDMDTYELEDDHDGPPPRPLQEAAEVTGGNFLQSSQSFS